MTPSGGVGLAKDESVGKDAADGTRSLILELTHPQWDSARHERVGRRFAETALDEGALIAICSRNKVLPLVARRLIDSDRDGHVPFRFKLLLSHVYEANLRRNELLLKAGATVRDALVDSGIPAIPLKGLALLGSVYRDFGARQLNDVDMLIPRADRTRAAECLRSLGYRPGTFDISSGELVPASAKEERRWALFVGNLHSFGLLTHDPFAPCVRIDLSYDVTGGKSNGIELTDSLLSNAVPSPDGSGPMLPPVDLLLHIVLHLVKEAQGEWWIQRKENLHLAKFVDMLMVIDHFGLAPMELTERASVLSVSQELRYALELSHAAYPTSVGGEILALLEDSNAAVDGPKFDVDGHDVVRSLIREELDHQ